jgi:hypothetical protein
VTLGSPSYIGSLGPLLSLDNLEFHGVAFLQAFVTLRCNGGIVDKYVRSAIMAYKTEPFCIVEPLDCPFQTIHCRYPLRGMREIVLPV